MTYRSSLSHSRFGFQIVTYREPWWLEPVENSFESMFAAAGHPCCGQGIGRIRFIENATSLLLHRVLDKLNKCRSRVYVSKVSTKEAQKAFPSAYKSLNDWIIESDDDDDDDDVYVDGVLFDAHCPRCGYDFAQGEPVTLEHVNMLERHMDTYPHVPVT